MKKKVTRNIIVFIIIAAVLQGGYFAYSMAGGGFTAKQNDEKPNMSSDKKAPVSQPEKAISNDEAVQIKKLPKKEVDTSKIEISKEIEDTIKKSDGKNSLKNINNYKKLLAELDVPEEFRKEIEKSFKKGRKVPDVLIMYEFLNENYGQINELEELIAQRESGKSLSQIFKEYKAARKEFVPSNFPEGYLEKLLNTSGITPDDVMIGDRISQKGLKKFEELMEMRKDGRTWKQINELLGVVNTADKMPKVAITSTQVHKHMEESKLIENRVVEALVIAGKTGREEKEIIDRMKAGSKSEDIYADLYEEKYK